MRMLEFGKDALLYDISNMAFVAADIARDSMTAHRLHQVFDVCESGNRDRVERILGIAFAEVGTMLRKIASVAGDSSDSYRFMLKREDIGEEWRVRLQEAVHEFMTARALADWLSITLPEAADVWKEKAAEARASLLAAASLSRRIRRRVPPI